MSEVLTYEHPEVGTQTASAGSPLALALASEEGWELIDGEEVVKTSEPAVSDDEHEAEVEAQAEIEAELDVE